MPRLRDDPERRRHVERNDYGSLIAQWKVDLIRSRARKFFFRDDEVPDLEQIIVPEIINAPFDPSAPGASERTFVISVVDRQLLKVKRDRKRDVRRVNYESESLDEIVFTERASSALERSEPHELRLDVQQVVAGLTPAQQAICQALAEGCSQADIARLIGRSKAAICVEVKRLREKFRAMGLGERAGEDSDQNRT
jgi:RNA polymerase sigma factor (sigma-70 family)